MNLVSLDEPACDLGSCLRARVEQPCYRLEEIAVAVPAWHWFTE
jgi:hypothetical protein